MWIKTQSGSEEYWEVERTEGGPATKRYEVIVLKSDDPFGDYIEIRMHIRSAERLRDLLEEALTDKDDAE